MWDISKKTLLIDGGLNLPKYANNIITNMFRYKPASVTKE
jgi:hypothetical protein